jgi:hypothetical protein
MTALNCNLAGIARQWRTRRISDSFGGKQRHAAGLHVDFVEAAGLFTL